MTSQRTIGWLAKSAGVHVQTVRYYERQQLLSPVGRPDIVSMTTRQWHDSDSSETRRHWDSRFERSVNCSASE